jgi:hypothetical protein
MSNKKRVRKYAGPRPVNPGQQELAIMRKMMEESMITRMRVEDAAQKLVARNNELQLIVAGLLHMVGGSATLTDEILDELSEFDGWDTERNEVDRSLTLYLIPAEDGEEE